MNSLLASTWSFLRALGWLERATCVALLGIIVVSIVVQVFTRYLLGQPIVWVEEVAGYAFLWAMFLGAAAGFKQLRHIRIDTFVSRLPLRPQYVGRGFAYLLCTVLALTIAWYAFDIMEIEARSSTMALPVELPRHLFYSVPLTVCMVSMALTGVHLVVSYWYGAATGQPVPAEVDAAERRRLEDEMPVH